MRIRGGYDLDDAFGGSPEKTETSSWFPVEQAKTPAFQNPPYEKRLGKSIGFRWMSPSMLNSSFSMFYSTDGHLFRRSAAGLPPKNTSNLMVCYGKWSRNTDEPIKILFFSKIVMLDCQRVGVFTGKMKGMTVWPYDLQRFGCWALNAEILPRRIGSWPTQHSFFCPHKCIRHKTCFYPPWFSPNNVWDVPTPVQLLIYIYIYTMFSLQISWAHMVIKPEDVSLKLWGTWW